MTVEELRTRAAELAPWHFDMELAPGLRTRDCNAAEYGTEDHRGVGLIPPEEMEPLMRTILPGGIEGRSFLDIGCNAGGYCFVANRLGAAKAHGFDVRKHWIDQAEFLKSALCPDAQSVDFQVADAKTFRHEGRFDVTLFKGIFYHLPDPIAALREACDLTTRAIIVDTAGRSDIPEDALVPWQESTTHVMSGVDGLAWFPGGPAVIRSILAWAGFPHTRTIQWVHGDASTRFRNRFRVVGWRDGDDHAAYAGPAYD